MSEQCHAEPELGNASESTNTHAAVFFVAVPPTRMCSEPCDDALVPPAERRATGVFPSLCVNQLFGPPIQSYIEMLNASGSPRDETRFAEALRTLRLARAAYGSRPRYFGMLGDGRGAGDRF